MGPAHQAGVRKQTWHTPPLSPPQKKRAGMHDIDQVPRTSLDKEVGKCSGLPSGRRQAPPGTGQTFSGFCCPREQRAGLSTHRQIRVAPGKEKGTARDWPQKERAGHREQGLFCWYVSNPAPGQLSGGAPQGGGCHTPKPPSHPGRVRPLGRLRKVGPGSPFLSATPSTSP